jgi:hypothetical protein
MGVTASALTNDGFMPESGHHDTGQQRDRAPRDRNLGHRSRDWYGSSWHFSVARRSRRHGSY